MGVILNWRDGVTFIAYSTGDNEAEEINNSQLPQGIELRILQTGSSPKLLAILSPLGISPGMIKQDVTTEPSGFIGYPALFIYKYPSLTRAWVSKDRDLNSFGQEAYSYPVDVNEADKCLVLSNSHYIQLINTEDWSMKWRSEFSD